MFNNLETCSGAAAARGAEPWRMAHWGWGGSGRGAPTVGKHLSETGHQDNTKSENLGNI